MTDLEREAFIADAAKRLGTRERAKIMLLVIEASADFDDITDAMYTLMQASVYLCAEAMRRRAGFDAEGARQEVIQRSANGVLSLRPPSPEMVDWIHRLAGHLFP